MFLLNKLNLFLDLKIFNRKPRLKIDNFILNLNLFRIFIGLILYLIKLFNIKILMIKDFFNGYSFLGLYNQHFFQQIQRLRVHISIHRTIKIKLAMLILINNLVLLLPYKYAPPSKQNMENQSQRKNIALAIIWQILGIIVNHLRCNEPRSSAVGIFNRTNIFISSQWKIHDCDCAYIFYWFENQANWFQISNHNLFLF